MVHSFGRAHTGSQIIRIGGATRMDKFHEIRTVFAKSHGIKPLFDLDYFC